MYIQSTWASMVFSSLWRLDGPCWSNTGKIREQQAVILFPRFKIILSGKITAGLLAKRKRLSAKYIYNCVLCLMHRGEGYSLM